MLLQDEQWKLYAVEEGGLQWIKTPTEARTPALHFSSRLIVYIGADGAVHEIDRTKQTETVVLQPDIEQSYAQPAYDRNARGIFLVALKDGNSADTDIVYFDREKRNLKTVVRQRSSQFEPYPVSQTVPNLPDNALLYSSVHCTIGCGKIIQEIWVIDTVSSEARQLTLMDSIARQPIVSAGELYFSANKHGHFHIWRQDQAGNAVARTTGLVTDINPVADQQGNVFFIRHTPDGTSIRRMGKTGPDMELDLGVDYEGLRDLRIDPFVTGQ